MLDSKELFEIKELCVKLGECSATYYLIQLMNDLSEANARLAGKWISADQPPEMVHKIERDGVVYSDEVLIVNGGTVSIGSYGKYRDRAAAWSDKWGQKAEAVTLWQALPAPPAAKEEHA